MFGFLLTILVLNGLFLCVIILLQAGKGGGLAAMGGGGTAPGTENLLGGRQASEFLVRATWAGGTLFLVLALVLSILSTRGFEGQPVLQGDPASAPSPLIPGAEDGAEEAPPAELPDEVPPGGEEVPPGEPPDSDGGLDEGEGGP